MCSKFDYNTINTQLNSLNYPSASNIQTETNYTTNQLCWISQLNKRFLNNPEMQKYLRTKHNILPTAKMQYAPYGTFMDFADPVYQDARICDLKYTPSVGYKKINNQDLFILKNQKKNESIIKSALDDFVKVDKQ
jgi:hypothetical protein